MYFPNADLKSEITRLLLARSHCLITSLAFINKRIIFPSNNRVRATRGKHGNANDARHKEQFSPFFALLHPGVAQSSRSFGERIVLSPFSPLNQLDID